MDNAKKTLHKWQDKLDRNLQAYAGELDKMDAREVQYKGGHALRPLIENGIDEPTDTPHVWNITSENIESEIDNSMPTGKVTPSRQQDNLLGKMIEAMLLDELDRLPAERINDRAERTCKVQGGVLYPYCMAPPYCMPCGMPICCCIACCDCMAIACACCCAACSSSSFLIVPAPG